MRAGRGWSPRWPLFSRANFHSGSAASPVHLPGALLAADVVVTTTALVCVIDLTGLVLLANPALLEVTGYREDDIVSRSIFDTLVIPEDVTAARASLDQASTAGTTASVEADWLDRSGGRLRIHMHSSVLRDAAGAAWAMAYVGTDVTEQRLLQTKLRERAETDALTGLRNRAAILTALQAALTEDPSTLPEPVGLLFCDLDGFKKVNDLHGHLVGDALLIEIGQRLLTLTRPPQLVSRLGGDEFLILTPAATPASLTRLAEAIEVDLRRPFVTRQGEVSISASVGTALGRAGDNPEQLIEQADRHMYGVKTSQSGTRARVR